MKGEKMCYFFGDYVSCSMHFERKSEKGFAPLSAFEMENGAMNRKRKCVRFIFHLNASPLAAQRKTSQQKTRRRIRPQVMSLPPHQISFNLKQLAKWIATAAHLKLSKYLTCLLNLSSYLKLKLVKWDKLLLKSAT